MKYKTKRQLRSFAMLAIIAGGIFGLLRFGPRVFGHEEEENLVEKLDDSAAGWKAGEELAARGSEAYEDLRIALRSDDRGQGAARALGLMGGPGIEILMGALISPNDPDLQRRAARGLVWAGPGAGTAWQSFWRNSVTEELERAAFAFEEGLDIRIPTTTTTRIERETGERDLARRAWHVANSAYTGLERVRAKPRLCAAVVIRETCVLAAKMPEVPNQLMRIVEKLGDRDQRVRVELVRAMGNLGPRAAPAVPRLLGILENDESTWVKALAATALGSIGVRDEGVLLALGSNLDHVDLGVRSHSIEALGALRVEDEAVVSRIVELVAGRSPERIAAVRAVGGIGAPARAALEDLYKIAKDEDLPMDMRLAAADSVLGIGGNPAAVEGALAGIARGASRDDHRVEAKQLLARLRGP